MQMPGMRGECEMSSTKEGWIVRREIYGKNGGATGRKRIMDGLTKKQRYFLKEENREKRREACRKWRADNSDRVRAYNEEWDKEHPDYRHDNYVKNKERRTAKAQAKKYGITPEEVIRLWHTPCEICGKSPEDNPNKISDVDHDHGRNVVRGALCHSDNSFLGQLQKRIESLQKYLDWIEKK